MPAHPRCPSCRVKYRVPPGGQTKKLRCGRCKGPIASPAIELKMRQVFAELECLSVGLHTWDWPSKHRDVERRLRRQKAILDNLHQFPGHDQTNIALFDLFVSIRSILSDVEQRIRNTVWKRAWSVVVEILRAIRVMAPGLPKMLPPAN